MMTHATYEAWLASRPPLVRETLEKFPPMSVVLLDEKRHYVIGADEAGALLVSPINPHEDYSGALDEQRSVCREHLATLRVVAVGKQNKPFSRDKVNTDKFLAELREALAPAFSADDIRLLLKALCPEGGYSKDPATARLQTRLSIMLAAAERQQEPRMVLDGVRDLGPGDGPEPPQ